MGDMFLILAPIWGVSGSANHSRAVAQHCINGDSLSQWRRAKFDPHRMETPEPIAKKFGTVDYVREATPGAKFCANPSTGGFWANAWNITVIFLIYTFFFMKSPTGQTASWIFTRNGSNDAVSPKDVLFWGYKVQNQYLIREKSRKKKMKIWPKTGRIFRPNTACSEIFISKLPLIVS